jgi:hypothetical protein
MLPRTVLELSPLLAPELESLYLRQTQALGEADQKQLVIGVLEPVKIDLLERQKRPARGVKRDLLKLAYLISHSLR